MMTATIETPAAFDIDARLDVLEGKILSLRDLVAELLDLDPDGDFAA